MYMAAGSGIPKIKTTPSGFVIPNFFDFKVLLVKAFGAVFAVATGIVSRQRRPLRAHLDMRRLHSGHMVPHIPREREQAARTAFRGLAHVALA